MTTTNWKLIGPEDADAALARWVSLGGDAGKFARGATSLLSDFTAPADALLPCDPAFPRSVYDTLEVVGPWFLRGQLPCGPRIAVVGTREPTPEGVRVCNAICRDLAASGVALISGGAIGVDTLAHEAAVTAGTPTVAFLPCGFDRLSPARNKRLFERIVATGGALVSEYPLGVSARKYHFRRRNELIATYADAVLVVRARSTGGTLITARAAQCYGRPLFAVPGSPEDATSAGCNALLREGARPIVAAAELLAELGIAFAPTDEPTTNLLLTAVAQELLDAVRRAPQSVDELCEQRAPSAVLAALTELEVMGCAVLVDGRWRAR